MRIPVQDGLMLKYLCVPGELEHSTNSALVIEVVEGKLVGDLLLFLDVVANFFMCIRVQGINGVGVVGCIVPESDSPGIYRIPSGRIHRLLEIVISN